MDFSASNTVLWNSILQFGIIAAAVLVCNIIRRKVPFIRKALAPTAVLAGFALLLLRQFGILKMDVAFLEMLTYHAIAIGFIALSLRVENKDASVEKGTGFKSGALIVSTYLVQALAGLLVTVPLSYTVMKHLFPAAGVLLPMGYGQGPGQANNIGSNYEELGFVGGQTFGLAIAAAGYLCACIIGVIYLNYLVKKKLVTRGEQETKLRSLDLHEYEDEGEIPIAESIDKFSVQVALVLMVYLATYLVTLGLTTGIGMISEGLSNMVSSLLWGFNFIIGSVLAIVTRVGIGACQKKGIIKRQYQNNYLLSRISGVAFDVMIVAGIASINIDELKGLWVPFILLAVVGAVVTFVYLLWMCKKLYPDYVYEGFVSMFGMLTGTISSGVLLVREIDPDYKTPAVNNLVVGSSYGIALGAPILVIVGLIAKSELMLFVCTGIIIVYLAILLFLMLHKRKR